MAVSCTWGSATTSGSRGSTRTSRSRTTTGTTIESGQRGSRSGRGDEPEVGSVLCANPDSASYLSLMRTYRDRESRQDRADWAHDRRAVRTSADQDADGTVRAIVGHHERAGITEGTEPLPREELVDEQRGAARKRDLDLDVDRLDLGPGQLGRAPQLHDRHPNRG